MQSGSYEVTARPASTTGAAPVGRRQINSQDTQNHGVSRKQESGHLPVADILTVAGRADAAHGADEIVVVEQSADLLGTELAAAVRVQNRPCRAPERDGVADRGRGQSSSDKTPLIPLDLTHADMGI